jgi:hypothetical protein
MSIVPKETIEVIAQSVGIPILPADVSAALAPDVEYRLREIMQVRRPFFPLPPCSFSNYLYVPFLASPPWSYGIGA